MTSIVFWASFAAVFLTIRWFANGVLSAAGVEILHVQPATADVALKLPVGTDEPDDPDEAWPHVLDEAA